MPALIVERGDVGGALGVSAARRAPETASAATRGYVLLLRSVEVSMGAVVVFAIVVAATRSLDVTSLLRPLLLIPLLGALSPPVPKVRPLA